jgi:hypothetical protein
MDLGYPCVKPDSVVMNVSKKLGLVPSDKGDPNLIEAVESIQQYCIVKNMKPSIIDLYFLIYGGQDGVRNLVLPRFYN